jgi:CRP/FNR family transcriptional regulator
LNWKEINLSGRIYSPDEKGELASHIGTVSETLSRSLKKMKEEGIIEVEGSRVVIYDMARLRQLAGK